MNNHAGEVKNLLLDPVKVVNALGWGERARRQARGLIIRCPAHNERSPSCSVRTAQDGTLGFHCFGCGWGGDVLTAIALAYNLRTTDDFREVIAIGAEIGGDHNLATEIRNGREATERKPVPQPKPLPETPYPDAEEVAALWREAGSVASDGTAARLLVSRGLDPSSVADMELARALRPGQKLPTWASYRGDSHRARTWHETGHTVITRVFDARGACRSIRAWRVTDLQDTPKRLPPSGRRSSELVLANRMAVGMLTRRVVPLRLLVLEGEPDFLVWATRTEDAVIGLMSGSWTVDFARAVPDRTEVIIRTHRDLAGDKYAATVAETIGERCSIWRLEPAPSQPTDTTA